MAYILEKIGNTYNLPKRYFTCDAKSDLDKISLVDAPTGSEAYCILEEETYILDSNKQWHKKKINEDLIEQVQVKLENKQDKLTFDSIPTKGSMNPVTSDGIKRYVDSNGGSGGSSGSSGDFMDKSVYDPQGKARDIFAYVDEMLGSAGAQVAKATLPKGRMRGDVDGDGEITVSDALLMYNDLATVKADPVMAWCADANGDGNVLASEVNQLAFYLKGGGVLLSTPTMADYYGNWTYVKVDNTSGYFYYDMAVEGVTAACSAIVAVQGDHKRDAFAGAECFDGYVRIKANLLPLTDAACLVFYSPGDGTAVVVQENVIDRTGVPLSLTVASASLLKTYTIAIDDTGVITATRNDGNAYPMATQSYVDTAINGALEASY